MTVLRGVKQCSADTSSEQSPGGCFRTARCVITFRRSKGGNEKNLGRSVGLVMPHNDNVRLALVKCDPLPQNQSEVAAVDPPQGQK